MKCQINDGLFFYFLLIYWKLLGKSDYIKQVKHALYLHSLLAKHYFVNTKNFLICKQIHI